MKHLWIGLLLFTVALTAPSTAFAQIDTDEYFDESQGLMHRLWFGGGFNLGFFQQNNYSAFNIGISPMVGYKITEKWSAGPRTSFQYTHVSGFGTDLRKHRVPLLSYTASAFTRFKLFRWLFAHLEYEYENSERFYTSGGLLVYDQTQARVLTERIARDNAYVGLGYTQAGGLLGYEISLLYNVLTPDQNSTSSFENPFSIRFGLNYNF